MTILIVTIIAILSGIISYNWNLIRNWVEYHYLIFNLWRTGEIVQKMKVKSYLIVRREQKEIVVTDISRLESEGHITVFQKLDPKVEGVIMEFEPVDFEKPQTAYLLKGGWMIWGWTAF